MHGCMWFQYAIVCMCTSVSCACVYQHHRLVEVLSPILPCRRKSSTQCQYHTHSSSLTYTHFFQHSQKALLLSSVSEINTAPPLLSLIAGISVRIKMHLIPRCESTSSMGLLLKPRPSTAAHLFIRTPPHPHLPLNPPTPLDVSALTRLANAFRRSNAPSPW